jgi:hypothetical protein
MGVSIANNPAATMIAKMRIPSVISLNAYFA